MDRYDRDVTERTRAHGGRIIKNTGVTDSWQLFSIRHT
jgi:hypothetical protein